MGRHRARSRSSDWSRRRRRWSACVRSRRTAVDSCTSSAGLGVTGISERLPDELPQTVERLRVGVDASGLRRLRRLASRAGGAVARIADGVVVGSAIVRAAGESVDEAAAAHRVIARRDRRGLTPKHRLACARSLSRGMRFHALVGILDARAAHAHSRSRSIFSCASASRAARVGRRLSRAIRCRRARAGGRTPVYLEEVAERIASGVLSLDDRIRSTRVAVRKPHVALPGPAGLCGGRRRTRQIAE